MLIEWLLVYKFTGGIGLYETNLKFETQEQCMNAGYEIGLIDGGSVTNKGEKTRDSDNKYSAYSFLCLPTAREPNQN